MIHNVTIGGRDVALEWNQDIASRFPFRASKIGGCPSMADFVNPRKSAAAVTSLLWLVLPPSVHALFSTPEDLFIAIDHEKEAESLHSALLSIIADMNPSAEKKSSLKKSRSPKSN
jgi:hypothetical protein